MGSKVIVVSQDSPEMLTATAKKHKLGFQFLSDGQMAASKAFGLTFKVNEETVKLYKKYNIDLVGLYGRAKPLMSVPAVFLIGAEGKIVFEYVNPNYQVRLEPSILKAAVGAYLKKGP